MPAQKGPRAGPARAASPGFTREERAAMRERAQELKAERSKLDGEKQVRAKIAEMNGSDRAIAERIHAIVQEVAPDLTPRTWYGMPAYSRGDEIVCFVQPAAKFGVRYATLGFTDKAKLDQGRMWPTTYAISQLTDAEAARIALLLRTALL